MAKKRFLSEQIVAILREAEKAPAVEEVLRKHGISDQTYYRWKRMYGNLGISEVQRIKQLEDENRKLKQLVGDQARPSKSSRNMLKKGILIEEQKGLVGILESPKDSRKTGLQGFGRESIELSVRGQAGRPLEPGDPGGNGETG